MWISREEYSDLKKERDSLRWQVEALEKIGKTLQKKIPFHVEEPSPTDSVERMGYVARAAGFYQDILEAKLKSLIADQREELANPGNPEKLDIVIKGTINAFSLLMDWGEAMINEHLANNQNNNGEN